MKQPAVILTMGEIMQQQKRTQKDTQNWEKQQQQQQQQRMAHSPHIGYEQNNPQLPPYVSGDHHGPIFAILNYIILKITSANALRYFMNCGRYDKVD